MAEFGPSSTDQNESQKIPFQNQTFVDFVGLLGRLFYDDVSIVLLDFLSREQKSFLESDLREKLGWRDTLIQQKLYLLEKHMIVVQDTPSNKARAPMHWRINNQLYGAVQWRYQQVVDRLTKLVNDAAKQHEFECSKRGCEAKYTALEAASCNRALDDEHPLCVKCGTELKPSEFEETKQQAKEKRAKALQLLQPLGQGLIRIGNMEIPVFPPYTKKDEIKEQENVTTTNGPTETPLPIGNSISSTGLQTTVVSTTSSPASSTSGASGFSRTTEPEKKSSLQFKFNNDAATTTTGQSKRVIPWFNAAANRGNEIFDQQNNKQIQSPAAATKFSFGLKSSSKHNVLNNVLNNTIRPMTSTVSSQVSTFSIGNISSSMMNCKTVLNNHLEQQYENQPQLVPIAIGSSMMDEIVDDRNEVEIEVKQLGRKFKISEITEEIEQNMTDDEYRVYYDMTELRL